MATAARDPRDIITPEAFRVADHLIGIPLAKPSRRLGAILIDLLLVAILVGLLDAVAFVIGLVGAFFVFRLSRAKGGRWYKRFYRHGLGCFGAVLTFTALIVSIEALGNLFRGGDDDGDAPGARATITSDSGNVVVEGIGVLASAGLLRDGLALRDAERPGQRDTLADAIVEALMDEGFTPAQVRASLAELETDEVVTGAGLVALEAAIETASARVENRAPRSAEQIRIADSTATANEQARLAAAAAALDSLPPADSALVVANDSIRALRARLDETSAELAREREQREAVEERQEAGAFRWVLSSITDELGLGLGWLGLYFTAFTVLGGGQTPGKRVFRLRVIRLDGRPIGWWTSLQRFGGYSASVFTGMLGFAEMFWDDNRQALQDKLVATVVIQEPRKGEAGATMPPLDEVADRIEHESAAQLELPAPPERLLPPPVTHAVEPARPTTSTDDEK